MKTKKLLSAFIAISMIISSTALATDNVNNITVSAAQTTSGNIVPSGGGGSSSDILTPAITVTVTPEDAVVKFFDAENNEITSPSLAVGEEYTYTASRYGYVSKTEAFTAEETLSITLDKITPLTVYGKNSGNMAITDIELPKIGALKWEQLISDDFNYLFTEPVFIEDALYLIEGNKVVKRSADTGAILDESDALADIAANWGINTLCFGDGMIFAPIDGGRVQAIDASTLESLWISESFTGDISTPLTYNNGHLYGGTAVYGTPSSGEYFCIETTDENPLVTDETKQALWKTSSNEEFDNAQGFYSAGAYAADSIVVFGSESGTVFACNAADGTVINSKNASGMIRSSISYADGNIYFTSKDGFFYSAPLTDEGIGELSSVSLGGEATSTPAVYDGLAYVGVKESDNVYYYAIIDTAKQEIAAKVDMPGYPQEDAVISTNGGTYVYTTYNNEPGGIYLITVSKSSEGVTASGKELFTPSHSQFCMSNITFDNDGTLYYKNDSGYLFAVTVGEDEADALDESKKAALEKLSQKFGIFSKSDYSSSNYEEIQNTYTKAAEDIKAAETTADVNKILDNAIAAMLAVSCRSDSRATVYISVEKFNIGQGYVKEPTELSVKKYTTAAQVLNNVLKDNMIYSGTLTSNFYLSAVADNNLKLNIPDFIKNAEGITITEERSAKGYLSEFDYTNQSGWVYTVNGELPDISASDYIIKNGDIIRFQFSLTGYGTDIYSSNTIEGHAKLAELADKDALTKQIAIVNGYSDFSKYMAITNNKRDYDDALETAKNPSATQRAVTSAVGKLESLEKPKTTSSSSPSYSSNNSGNSGGISQTINNTVTTDKVDKTDENKEIFTDVTEHWAKDYIYKLYDKKIVSGRTETTFDPNAQLTRAECIALLSRIAGADVSQYSGSDKFSDVASDSWYNTAVGWAAQNGIVSGISDTEFAPVNPITREQFVVMLARFAKFMNVELKATAEEITFNDENEFSEYAVESIGQVQRAGIISGKEQNIFAPKDYTTRAETAKMLSYFVD